MGSGSRWHWAFWRFACRVFSEPPTRRRWTEIFAVAFVILGVTYLNIFKNVEVWTKTAVPTVMRAPLFKFIELSASTWFNVVYALLAAAVIWLMMRHARRPIPGGSPFVVGAGSTCLSRVSVD
jgi:hypothetical protein